MTQPSQSDRQSPAPASNRGSDPGRPIPSSSISLAGMESLLKAARENVANVSHATSHEELGPGDVQYFRGETTTTNLNLEQAMERGWFESPSPPDALLQHAERQLAEAMASPAHESLESRMALANATNSVGNIPRDLSAHRGLSLEDLGDLELNISIELGRTELLIEEVLKLREGAVVSLDKLAGDPVDIIANGRLVARGELLVIDGKFGVRLSEVL
ncbi:flagellar motor switch protein FliN [Schlesneria paludicola]|uniref:flagellar motor switch protein FliN n=1 Tax=Schlesneria paludicola TaxID=360056 RepID=UPI000299DB4E|nr:flagellar motor switch protein FliN [Schlesneria paludicola]